MSRLSTVDLLRSRANVDDIPEFNAAFLSGLEAATGELSKYLRTPFDQTAYVDTFIPRSAMVHGGDGGLSMSGVSVINLALKAGFLTAPPTMVYAPDFDTLTSAPISFTNFFCDLEKGFVQVRSTLDLTGQIIQVSYTAGFTNSDGDYNAVPTWLATGAEQMALTIVDRTLPGLRGATAKDWSPAAVAVRSSLVSHVRFFPNSEKPL